MGTNYIAPTWRQPENTNKDKLSNYSLYFDGSGHEIDCGTGDDVNITGPISISVWFNADNITGARGIVCKNDAAAQQTYAQYFFDLLSNEIRWRAGKNTVSYAINTGQWYHAVGVYDGSNITLYIDGNSVVTASALADSYASAQPMYIGRRLNQDFFEGEIGQVCIFDYAIDQDQITYLYNLNNPMAISGAEPVAYWPLGDNANPIATAGYPNISVGADSVFQIPGGNTFPNTITFGTKNSEELKITNKITISIWIKTTDNNVSSMPLEPFLTRNQYSEGWLIGKRWETSTSDGFLRMWFYNADGTNNMLDAAGNWDDIANGEWHHIAYTYDGTSNAGGLKVYVDGQPSNSMATASTGIKDSTGSNWDTLILGMRQYTYETIDGEYSNLSIFNTDLPATGTQSIESLYANGTPPEISNYNNLVGWWKLNQTANWEADSTGNWQIPDALSSYPQSFNFNDTTDAINVGGISLGTVHTINFWVNFKPPYGTRAAYILSSGSENGWVVYANNGGTLYYKAGSSQYYSGTMTAPTAAGVGEWHNITITRNGANINFYQNGNTTPFATTSTFAGASTPLGDIDFISADRSYGSSIRYSNFTFYDTEFSPSQVSQIYNNGVPLTSAIATSNLKAWYKLDNTDKFNTVSTDWNVFNNVTTEPSPNYITALSKTGYGANYLTCKSTTLPFSTDDVITSSFWMKTSYTGGNFGISSGVIGVGPFCYISGQLGIFRGANNYRYFGADTGFVNDGNWHHILLYSPGYAQLDINSVRLFIDGTEYSVGGTGYTAAAPTYEVNYFGGYIGSSGYINGTDTLISSNAAVWNSDQTSNISEIYNNGTPPTSYSNDPSVWWTLTDIATTTGGGWYDSSGNGNTVSGVTNDPTVVSSSVLAREYALSSGMTAQNLVNNNVSTLNGESTGMDTNNLVQSNITKQVPFSSYSTQFDGLNHFGGSSFSAFELQTLSYSIWFKRTGSLSGTVCLITQGSSSNKGWTLWLRDTTITAQFGAGNNNSYFGSEVTSYKNYIPDNTWGNITATCDGTDQKIYVNGILRNTYTDVATIDYSSVVGFRIGERVTGSSNFYGEISNPAVWNQVLTDDDVLNIYNAGVPQDLSDFRITPLAWWELGGKYTYWNGTDLIARSTSTGDFDVTGTNTSQSQIVGNAPKSTANGVGTNLTIADLKGDMKSSTNNSYSINMADYADGITNPASSGRSTIIP